MLYSVNNTSKSEVLRVIPDFNYAKTHTMWNQADFSGRMMMYDYTEKNFLGGWKYTNGVPVKRIYEYETAGETPPDDCDKVYHIERSSATGKSLKDLQNEYEKLGYVIIKTYSNGFDLQTIIHILIFVFGIVIQRLKTL